MTTYLIHSTFLMLAALVSACSMINPAPPLLPVSNEIYEGAVRWSCAPHDALAVELTLHADPLQRPPQVNVILWNDLPIMVRRTYHFDSSSQDGIGSLQFTERDWQVADRTQIRFSVFREDERAEGSFSMQMPDGQLLSGRFMALWDHSFTAICG